MEECDKENKGRKNVTRKTKDMGIVYWEEEIWV